MALGVSVVNVLMSKNRRDEPIMSSTASHLFSEEEMAYSPVDVSHGYTFFVDLAERFFLCVLTLFAIVKYLLMSPPRRAQSTWFFHFSSRVLSSSAVYPPHMLTQVVPFFFTTWEHYYTDQLILPIINGPSEGVSKGH